MIQAQFVPQIAEIDSFQWDALRPDDNPFLSHAFLLGLEQHGCLTPRNGWRPHHLVLREDARVVAVAPCYLKANSHGEFVFDHAWADAYWRNGIDYYPKLLCAVPYSPVTGPRLLTGLIDVPQLREAAMLAMQEEVQRRQWSSAHITFDQSSTDARGWLERFDWQFHWRAPAACEKSWRHFDDFLDALTAKKRKNIRQERAQVARAGVRFRQVTGSQASDADLAAIFDFYLATFAEKGNLPVLTLAFLRHLAQTIPEQLLLILAERHGQAIAGALLLRSSTTLYGRYWGCSEALPGLHFETCYYQGIDYCLANGLTLFEPGAQGEHKLARGFLPSRTRSLHHIADPRFRAAIKDSLEREAQWQHSYRDQLMQHSPYRVDAVASAARGSGLGTDDTRNLP
ncbi:MAG: GNAT family N-acetyltransferase [Pseudomarimonas sp.]